MNNTQFIKIIRTFTPDEIKKFRRFLLSPYFNTNVTLVKLFDHLTKKYNKYSGIDNIKIFRSLYPGKPYNKKRIRDLSSEMLGLCERFLAEEVFFLQKNNISLNTLNKYNQKSLKNRFLSKYNETLHELTRNKMDYDQYLHITTLDKEMFKFHNTWNYLDAGNNADLVMNNTIKTFSFEILRCIFAFETLAMVKQLFYDKGPADEVLKLIERFDFFKDPVIKIYYDLCMIHKHPEKDLYDSIKKQFDAIHSKISDDIKKEILSAMHNFLYGSPEKFTLAEIRAEGYDLLSYIFNNELECDINGYVITNYFLNYADLLIHFSKYEKALDLINKCKDRLGTIELKEDTINFIYSQLYYSKKEFTEALKYLELISYKDKELHAFKKSLELNSYYELKDFLMLDKQMESAKKYYLRNSNIKLFEGFIPYILSMEKLIRYHDNRSQLEKLRTRISNSQTFSYRNWLIRMITERIKELSK